MDVHPVWGGFCFADFTQRPKSFCNLVGVKHMNLYEQI